LPAGYGSCYNSPWLGDYDPNPPYHLFVMGV
jgi:hypothetical protein